MISLVERLKKVVGPASPHVLETEIDGEISVYDAKKERVSVLNGTASDIWRLADGTHSLQQITQLLASSYQVAPEVIADDVIETVETLSEAGLLESP